MLKIIWHIMLYRYLLEMKTGPTTIIKPIVILRQKGRITEKPPLTVNGDIFFMTWIIVLEYMDQVPGTII